MRSRRDRLTLLAVLAVLALATGCTDGEGTSASRSTADSTSSTTSTRPTTTTTAPTTTTTVVLPPPTPVQWRGCGDGLDCARVTVPVDYQAPSGATLELALVRRPADDPTRRIGTVLVNPGGPGASGVRRVRRGFEVAPEVGARFDVVGFDPRGVGDSAPITCGSQVPAFRALDLAPDDGAEELRLVAAAQVVADECRATEGDRLGHLGSDEVAHDIEVIRRAIGEPTISFVGLSYGTLIGQLWAERYPQSVRALVLDGVVDPEAGSTTASLAQVRGVDDAFDAMAFACGADPTCRVRDRGLATAYDELARRVEAGAGSSVGVGPTQLAYAVFYATYDDATWPRLWDAIAAGLDGRLGSVAELARSYTRLVPYAPFALITCLDGAHAEGYDAWKADGARFAEVSPRFGRLLANELLPCAFWPPATSAGAPVDAAGAPPILVIGSTGDAATPLAQAERVAEHLDSGVLLTVEIDGHVAIGDSPCATDRVARYLVDLAVPEPGARC